MKKSVIILSALIFYFLFSCKSSGKDKSHIHAKDSIVIYSEKENFDRLYIDTTKFNKLNDIITYFNKKTDSIYKLRAEAYKNQKYKPASYKESIDTIESFYYGLIEKRNEYIFKYITGHEKNSENMNGLIYLIVDTKIPVLLIDSLYKQFPAELRNLPNNKLFLTKIEERKKAEINFQYDPSLLDLKFEDINGDQITLQEVNSRLLLLDFWASWCAPCRYENRILVKEREKIIGDADISIVAVSLDTDKSKWIKAAKDDGFNYLTVCDFKALESPIVKRLKIQTVPYNLLIDKQGKILAHNLWSNELTEFIKTLK
ncbi:MAG: TlpA family protein disulfide reductase [Chitinophagaceae bacterium]